MADAESPPGRWTAHPIQRQPIRLRLGCVRPTCPLRTASRLSRARPGALPDGDASNGFPSGAPGSRPLVATAPPDTLSEWARLGHRVPRRRHRPFLSRPVAGVCFFLGDTGHCPVSPRKSMMLPSRSDCPRGLRPAEIRNPGQQDSSKEADCEAQTDHLL